MRLLRCGFTDAAFADAAFADAAFADDWERNEAYNRFNNVTISSKRGWRR
jgi:hypothetical protein